MTASLLCKPSVTEQIPRSHREPLSDGSTRMRSSITTSYLVG